MGELARISTPIPRHNGRRTPANRTRAEAQTEETQRWGGRWPTSSSVTHARTERAFMPSLMRCRHRDGPSGGIARYAPARRSTRLSPTRSPARAASWWCGPPSPSAPRGCGKKPRRDAGAESSSRYLIDNAHPPLGFGRMQAVALHDWSGAEASEAFQTLIADIAAVVGPPHATAAAGPELPSFDGQHSAPAPRTPATVLPSDEPSSSASGGRDGHAAPPAAVVNRTTGDASAPAARPANGPPPTSGSVDRTGGRWRWAVAAVSVLAIIALSLYLVADG